MTIIEIDRVYNQVEKGAFITIQVVRQVRSAKLNSERYILRM